VIRALLDANVLYPAPLRDYLLSLAAVEVFQPKWTQQIHDEWIRNLLMNRKDLTRTQLTKTQQAMDAAFPDADVTGYSGSIDKLDLPDVDDRHVLAAAIHGDARTIVTMNLKDFPTARLRTFDIVAQHPDAFVTNLIQLEPESCLTALRNQVSRLRNPPKTIMRY